MNTLDGIKKKIIISTIREIKVYGYEPLSLRRLVKDVHLTTGAFYKRFPNKRSLFLTVTKVISSEIYQQILPKIGDYQQHARQSLIQLGIGIIELFHTEPNLMEFLFFNNELSIVYRNKELGNQFPLLKLTKEIVALNVNCKDVDVELIKLWSFIQGYGNLINHHVCKFNLSLVKETLDQLLGDNINE